MSYFQWLWARQQSNDQSKAISLNNCSLVTTTALVTADHNALAIGEELARAGGLAWATTLGSACLKEKGKGKG